MRNTNHTEVKNGSTPAEIKTVPVLSYDLFYDEVRDLLGNESKHCISYYCHVYYEKLKFICCIADDETGRIKILSHEARQGGPPLRSITPVCSAMHIFEREIHENFGVEFEGHPWLKPVRYPHDRTDRLSVMDNYPFYGIESEELHEVGVGPVHAGVIEPGHFRFICNGEKVLHLEIQLGYQHRGIEKLFADSREALQRSILAENIAGDTAVGHGLAHAQLIESLSGIEVCEALQIERCIALELERMAVHIGDTAALCGDVAYQLGQVTCEALRTMVINTTQFWCGNRFGKGLIRPGGSNYPMTDEIADEILGIIAEVERRYGNVTDCIYSLPSVLGRFEDIGTVTRQQAATIGAVGMAARTCGMLRDIRKTHPFQYYKKYNIDTVTLETGDVLARGMLRALEVKASAAIIRGMVEAWRKAEKAVKKPDYIYRLRPDSFAISLTEGWRGEICHTAVTDSEGNMAHYKVKDSSQHNWMALALAVRNQEISDFPVCNKSFNLSYCGHDL
ncbi:NADH dehydrogenase subunit [bacterium]|nr:NADH dehydrogenase subunit [bacterium]